MAAVHDPASSSYNRGSLEMSSAQPVNPFEEVLQAAADEFKRITNQEHNGRGEFTLQSVMGELDRKLNAPAAPDQETKKHRTKQLVYGALSALQVLNGIAAQAASTLIPNSNICFNAVGWLLTIPQKIEDLNDGIGGLFEELHSYMIRFKILDRADQQSGGMPQEMIDTTGDVMKCFVRIIAECYDLWNPHGISKKIKFAFSAVTMSKVQPYLNEFKILLEKQDSLTGAVTLEQVLKTNRDLSDVGSITRAISEAVSEMRERLKADSEYAQNTNKGVSILVARDEAETYREGLLKILDLHKDDVQVQLNERDRVHKDAIHGSGSWLKGLSAYRDWYSRKAEHNLLVLRGKQSCGKHYLAARIGSEPTHSGENGRFVAYYHFRQEVEGQDLGLPLLSKALKTMACQLADQCQLYLKALLRDLESELDHLDESKASSLDDLWRSLQFSWTFSDTESPVILIFDGVDHLQYRAIARLSEVLMASCQGIAALPMSKRPRVLITGTDEGTSNLGKLRLFRSSPSVVVDDHNSPDILEYVKYHLRTEDVFKGLNDLFESGRDRELQTDITDKLPLSVAGVFSNAMAKLTRLRLVVEAGAEDPMPEIKQILNDKTGSDRQVVAKNSIEALDRAMNSKEIEQLNIALQWLIYASDDLTIETRLLKAVFAREGVLWDLGLQSFDRRIANREKLGRILSTTRQWFEDFIKLDSDVAAYLKDPSKPELDTEAGWNADLTHGTMSITFTGATRSEIRRLFADLSDRIIVQPMPLTPREQSNVAATVQVDEETSFSKIAEHTLDAINNCSDEHTTVLLGAGLPLLPKILRRGVLRSNGQISIVFKNSPEILRGLILMLIDSKNTVRALVESGCIQKQLCSVFLEDQAAIETFSAWLVDADHPNALSELKPIHRQSLQKLVEQDRDFWKPVTIEIAREWLMNDVSDSVERSYNIVHLFSWIDKYIEMRAKFSTTCKTTLAQDAEEGGEADNIPCDTDSTKADRIRRAFNWAKEQLGGSKFQLTKHGYRCLGLAYADNEQFNEAEEVWKEEAERFPPNWSVHRRLAAIGTRRWDAVKTREALIAAKLHLDTAVSSIVPGEKPSGYARIMKEIATRQLDAGMREEAVKNWIRGLRSDWSPPKDRFNCLEAIVQNSSEDEFLDFASDALLDSKSFEGLTELAVLFILAAQEDRTSLQVIPDFGTRMADHGMGQEAKRSIHQAITHVKKETPLELGTIARLGLFEIEISSRTSVWNDNTELQAFSQQNVFFGDLVTIFNGSTNDATKNELECILRQLNLQRGAYHLQQLKLGAADKLEQIETLVNQNPIPQHNLHGFLVRAYLYQERKDDAKEVLLPKMRRLFRRIDRRKELFEFSANYKTLDRRIGTDLTVIFASLDADDDALAAFSAIPLEKISADRVDAGPPVSVFYRSWICDTCLKPLRHTERTMLCKICTDMTFCPRCFEVLESPRTDACRPEHDFLELPAWPEGGWTLGKDKVRMGGWARPDGEVLETQVWLDRVREEWGIPKHAPTDGRK